MKWLRRTLLIILFSIIFSSIGFQFSSEYFSTVFTVIGIMFSVAFSQILAFSFSDISNDNFVKRQRNQLVKIRNIFIMLFALSAGMYLFKDAELTLSWYILIFSLKSIYGLFYLFCLYYFIQNFLALIDLKNEIEDLVRNSKK